MLTISKHQKEKIGNVLYEKFIMRMCTFLRQNFNISNAESNLFDKVHGIVAEAQNYGFESEETIEQYLFLKWKYKGFNRYPMSHAVLEIINYPDREPQKIIDELIYYFEKQNVDFGK